MRTEVRHVTTERLDLTPVRVADLDEVYALHSDARLWNHFPSGRHTDPERTREFLVERERQWRADGLGYWLARLREPLGPAAQGQLAGVGGCAAPAGKPWWNLYYRIVAELHGRGLAAELCRAALAAAHAIAPERPVLAYLLEANLASARTAERAGLTLAWRGPDAGNPDPTAVRLVYADRPLAPDVLAAIAGQP